MATTIREENEYETATFIKQLNFLKLNYDPGDVITITKQCIPAYVTFILGLGQNFNLKVPLVKDGDKIDHHWQIFLQKMYDQADEKWKLQYMKQFFQGLYQNAQTSATSEIEHFIYNQTKKTEEFLKKNPDIMVTQADKGGKIIILDREEYLTRLQKHLDDGIKNGTYE